MRGASPRTPNLRIRRDKFVFALFRTDEFVYFLVRQRRKTLRIEPALDPQLICRIDDPDQVNRDFAWRAGERLPGYHIANDVDLILHRELVVELFNPEREFVVDANYLLIRDEHGRWNLPDFWPVPMSFVLAKSHPGRMPND